MARSEGIRLRGSPGCAGLRRNCEPAEGVNREESKMQKRDVSQPVTLSSRCDAMLPGVHVLRHRDAMIPPTHRYLERVPGGNPVVPLLSSKETSIQAKISQVLCTASLSRWRRGFAQALNGTGTWSILVIQFE